jgi:hypothetical protein
MGRGPDLTGFGGSCWKRWRTCMGGSAVSEVESVNLSGLGGQAVQT